MPLDPAKYKRVPDLYVLGKEVVLVDGSVIWMQVLNPMERDEAQHDAQVARARTILTLKGSHATDERDKVVASYWIDGREAAVKGLVSIKLNDKLVEIVQAVRTDPEWKERVEIIDRFDDMSATITDAERAQVEDLNTQYIEEVKARQDVEREFLLTTLRQLSDDELIEDYVDVWADRRGGETARAEYEITELWYAARCCEGREMSPGNWDHTACEGHRVNVFADKSEVRALPDALQELLRGVMQQLSMTVWDAKNSVRQGSSSDSSPLPSEGEGSTPSTPTEIHAEPLGTSPQPSATP